MLSEVPWKFVEELWSKDNEGVLVQGPDTTQAITHSGYNAESSVSWVLSYLNFSTFTYKVSSKISVDFPYIYYNVVFPPSFQGVQVQLPKPLPLI